MGISNKNLAKNSFLIGIPKPPTYPPTHPPTQPPTHPPIPPPTSPSKSRDVVRYPPKYPGKDIYSEEDVEDDHEPEPEEDLISSDEQGDFFVLKHHRHRRRQNHGKLSHRKPPKVDYDEDDFVDFGERRSVRTRNIGEDSSVEGDVFQYEDFDLPDPNYLDSEESETEFRNISWVQPPKDGIALRRRRVYSKWSRWTKCSPKCTTRRYK